MKKITFLFKDKPSKAPKRELVNAIKEGKKILEGKKKAKSYTNMYEMLKDLEK